MFKSSVVFALALLSVADGKRILRGEKKERTQQKKRQFTLLTDKESQMTAFHLTPGQEISAHSVRRLLAEDKQERRRRELRGGNGGGKSSGKSTEESSDGPEFSVTLNDDASFVALTGMSGEFLSFVETNDANVMIAGICGSTKCRGELSAIAEGYECDPDGDEFEDTCLDVIINDDITGADFICPEPTDVMTILTATCVCTGPNPSGTCTVPTTLMFNDPSYELMLATNMCVGPGGAGTGSLAVTATLVCESVIAGSSTSASGKSKSTSTKSKSRRQ